MRIHDRERRLLQDPDADISSDEILDDESKIISESSESEGEEVFNLEDSDQQTLTPTRKLSKTYTEVASKFNAVRHLAYNLKQINNK